MKIKNWLSTQYQKYKRVWLLLRKPTMKEFKMVSKVTAIGLFIIGAIGFIISVAIKLLFK